MNETTYHHGELRISLIEQGILIINEQGIAALSLRKVAAKCRVSHSAPYRHFKNKEELLLAIQQHVEERFAQALQASLIMHRNQPDVMDYFGQAYVNFFIEHPNHFTLLTTQATWQVSLSAQDNFASNYKPFILFRDSAFAQLKK